MTASRGSGGKNSALAQSGVDLDGLEAGVRAGDRAQLGRAITLIESRLEEHEELAQQLLERLLRAPGAAAPPDAPPDAGQSAWRVGITGVPGVGKSTFIETLGTRLTAKGHRVAVLAVDPTSRRTGGSILGDKTRMQALSNDPAAFVRPSPTSGTLGGVARRTRETMVLVEAAGYDVVLVETVGAGQSETAVSEMVDSFLVLMLPGAGDELQGIKKGVLEVADLIAVNKADAENRERASAAAAEYRSALHILEPASEGWRTPILLTSGLTGEGMDELWSAVVRHREQGLVSGAFEKRRRNQQRDWLWSLVEDGLLTKLRRHPAVTREIDEVEQAVCDGQLPAAAGAKRLLRAFEES